MRAADHELMSGLSPGAGYGSGLAEFEAALEAEFETGVGGAFEAQRELVGVDTRVQVKNTLAAPFRYICQLEYKGKSMGTGVLIGPRTVLTVAHNIALASHVDLRVIPGRNGTSEPLPATRAVRTRIAPGAHPHSPTDFGVIHLRNPIGNQVGFWSRTYRRSKIDPTGTSISAVGLPLPAGVLKVNISGYPADKPTDPKLGCVDTRLPAHLCRGTEAHSPGRDASRCGTFPYMSYDQTVKMSGGMLLYLNDTCHGDSGSPIWVKRHPSKGGRVLIGLHVGKVHTGPAVNQGAPITKKIMEFINANTI